MRLLAALLLCATSLAAQTNAASMNRIRVARFIMVTTETGDVYNPRTDSEDRQLASELQSQLQEWKRFIVVYKPEQADIVLSVRAGGVVRPRVGVSIGHHEDPQRPGVPTTTTGTMAGGDIGPKDDLLSVYDASSYPDGGVLWRATEKNGLSGKLPLFERFKKDVEKADKEADKQSKSKKP